VSFKLTSSLEFTCFAYADLLLRGSFAIEVLGTTLFYFNVDTLGDQGL